MSFLLDTNVVTELRKPTANANVRAWMASVDDADLHLSVLVVGELRQGIELLRRRDPPQAEALDGWLAALEGRYQGRLIRVSVEVADEWGRLNLPDPLPTVDGLLAATAKVHGMTLATRNVGDVQRAGVPVVNPFERGPG